MRAWTGQKAYKNWSGLLAASDEDEFERKVLPLLRLFWPELQQAPRKRAWDSRGIDLFVWADEGRFPCVVQCKGFKVQTLGLDQVRQAEESIARFVASDAQADVYLLVHNREAKDREFVTRVQRAVEGLVGTGKARSAELWDRQTLLRRVFEKMEERLRNALHERSRRLLQHFEELFRFGEVRLPTVPAVKEELVFSRGSACSRRVLTSSACQDVAASIARSSGTQWTIVTGIFGVGKTTAALHSAASAERPVLVVPCAAVPPEVFRSGSTNSLTRQAARMLDVLEGLTDPDQQILAPMAAAVLSYLLRLSSSRFVVVLDGLDENRAFASLEGLQQLANQIAEFACPIVLTTRREHLDLMLGDFNVALAGLARKYGQQRVAIGFHLQPWSLTEVRAMVAGAIKVSQGEEAARLKEIGQLMTGGGLQDLYGDLAFHPLFLQFILEDVAMRGIRRLNRPGLLRSWIERKLRRDRDAWMPGAAVTRPQVSADLDVDEAVEKTLEAMQRVAFEMTARGKEVRLTESIASSVLLKIVEEVFHVPAPRLLNVLLNSVLVLHERRPGADHVVGFALRILQEYFLAAFLKANGLDPSLYPEPVQALHTEMGQA